MARKSTYSKFQEKLDNLLAKENFAKTYHNTFYIYRKYNDITVGIHDKYVDFMQTDENGKNVSRNSFTIVYSVGKKLILQLIPEIHKCKTYERLRAKYENLEMEHLLDKLL